MALVITVVASAAENSGLKYPSGLKYTKDHPLVYEDLLDLPPFSYINDEGKPDGFNIALVKEMMKRLGVPYVIKLKHTPLNFQDVSNGTAALTIGMKASYHDKYGAYSANTLVLFTHSVASPNNKPSDIHTFDDLRKHKVYVHRNSFSHNQMIEAGMEANAIPADDMKSILIQVAERDSGIILWNTSTLKELTTKNHLTNIKLTPVNMKYGEYHFMSRDSLLLEKLDSIYNEMVAKDEVLPLRRQWFYPEIQNDKLNNLLVYPSIAIGIFILILIAYNIYYKVRERRLNELNEKQKRRLALLLKAGKVGLWTYNTNKKTFTILNPEGSTKEEFNTKTFALFFAAEDFVKLSYAIEDIEAGIYEQTKIMVKSSLKKGNEKDSGDMAYHDLNISVLQKEEDMPTVLIGIMHDVTAEKKRFIETRDNLLKYRTIFNTSMADLAYYDENGILTDINQNACDTFGIKDRESLINSHTHISDIPVFMGLEGDVCREMWTSSITDMDKLHMEKESTKYWTRTGMIYYEFTIIPIYDANGKPKCFVSCGKDVTEMAKKMNKERMRQRRIENTSEQIKNYTNNINYALQVSGTRLANYYTDTHEMTIAHDIEKPMLRLSSLRCVTLLDNESRDKVAALFNNLDKKRIKRFDLRVGTIFKNSRKDNAYYEFNGLPIKKNGKIDHYFCLCRNVSQLVETERQLAEETRRAQEAEEFQNSFLKNMSHEIRTPLYTVVGFAELFQSEHDQADEPVFIDQIKQNSDHLLKLVNHILLLSRLDAKMVETQTNTVDFPDFFRAKCLMGWTQGVNEGVKTKIETTDEHLFVEIDDNHVGQIIETMCRLASMFTEKGDIITRYIYHSGLITMTFKDTGNGMDEERKKEIRERNLNSTSGDYGVVIQLIICQQLASLMGGQMEFESIENKGTTFWITIPCKLIDAKISKENDVRPQNIMEQPADITANGTDLLANSTDLLANIDSLSEEEINQLLNSSDLFK